MVLTALWLNSPSWERNLKEEITVRSELEAQAAALKFRFWTMDSFAKNDELRWLAENMKMLEEDGSDNFISPDTHQKHRVSRSTRRSHEIIELSRGGHRLLHPCLALFIQSIIKSKPICSFYRFMKWCADFYFAKWNEWPYVKNVYVAHWIT